MTLSQKFFNRKQAQYKVHHYSQKKRKEEKGKAKKIPKIEKNCLKILISAHARVIMH